MKINVGESPWTVTRGGQTRYVPGWAYPLVGLLALPAGACFIAMWLLTVVATLAMVPAGVVGWLLGVPDDREGPSDAAG